MGHTRLTAEQHHISIEWTWPKQLRRRFETELPQSSGVATINARNTNLLSRSVTQRWHKVSSRNS